MLATCPHWIAFFQWKRYHESPSVTTPGKSISMSGYFSRYFSWRATWAHANAQGSCLPLLSLLPHGCPDTHDCLLWDAPSRTDSHAMFPSFFFVTSKNKLHDVHTFFLWLSQMNQASSRWWTQPNHAAAQWHFRCPRQSFGNKRSRFTVLGCLISHSMADYEYTSH